MSKPEADVVERFLGPDGLDYGGWKRALREGVLLGQRCADCGYHSAAPKAACVECGGRDLGAVALPTEGRVFSETEVAVAPEQFEGPYRVALVDLGPTRVMARVEGDADIGDEVELTGVVDEGPGPGPLFG